uniref:Probable ATP-binding protein YheS n=1 Tax=Candidatus Kentrum sp. DK TaxID=2126562 RepID=A0A450S257_9GAMM|nr:MAG: ATP-binding cassette, subfamily F, member 3 [Candidatus Kentron sp. DK]
MLQLQDLTLSRDGRNLLEKAELTVHPGQRVGVIGANGCGKSSLFALLQGRLHHDNGNVDLPAQWTIASVAQEMPATDRSALDWVLDGDRELRQLERELNQAEAAHDGVAIARLHDRLGIIDGYDAGRRATLLLHGLGFAPGEELRPVASFSGGWRRRINLAQALMCRSDLLLLDEPTNHLDLDAVLWLEQWLRERYTGTLLLVSHDREFLDRVAERIAHFEDKTLVSYRGNYSRFETLRAERIASLAHAATRQQREIAHMQSFVERFRAKATKARQAQSRLKALERMQTIAAVHVESPFQFRIPSPERFGNPLLKLEKAQLGYGDKTILARVTLNLAPGDRVGLLGRNGAGKSTLVKALAGEIALQGGKRVEAGELRVGYFAQHQLEQLDPDAGGLLHLQRLAPEATEKQLRKFLGGFAFSGDHALRPTRSFSGGEKARLTLALITWQRPHLLLLDEPTNHLDMEMRDALGLALQEYGGALILVSHDRYLLRATTDTWLLVNDGLVENFAGDLEDYRDWLLMDQREARKRERRESPRQQIKKLEQDMARMQEELAQVARSLADVHSGDPDHKRNKQRRLKLLLRQGEIGNALAQREEEWLERSEELEKSG